ncbi:uncharacterized protein ACLA_083020 [Aspergillus clavatus NRRL 1]|uniref:Uncharacterized protein n=1 Tax=Aspergillus clavatus (strain ATCC 1007 / CBS 513.65 / DSM 816 / NCTC 3887 / NRRL 1 / QM 1276 / 107) TaxID=344612 RepID=A1CTH2_ASPCL|nr:uncharacterized protein ACLA_083020 [Aspergillus clavatus NRRL 1]EAW06609.1 conserved hypothetical protein [Aspergillus clavatus NRRL 1]
MSSFFWSRLRRHRGESSIVESSPHPAMWSSAASSPVFSAHDSKSGCNHHADTNKRTQSAAHHEGLGRRGMPFKKTEFLTPRRQSMNSTVDPADHEPAFIWKDISPPVDSDQIGITVYFNSELLPDAKPYPDYMDSRSAGGISLPAYANSIRTTPMNSSSYSPTQSLQEDHERQAFLENAVREKMLGSGGALPLYNEVSGAVIVDQEGLPHFLSPQEEAQRKKSLKRAVEEKMKGLPRRTEFNWAQAPHGPTLPAYSPGRHG